MKTWPPNLETYMRWIFAALLSCLCGCSGVVANRPVGIAPVDLTGQTNKWTGTWQNSYGACAITVADAANGVLAMTSTKPVSWWRWSNEIQRIYVRTDGEWTYASMESSDGTNTVYVWGRIANEDGTILWWLPDAQKFKTLVEAGTLPGTVEKFTKKKKSTEEQSIYPIVGYTESGQPIYQTTDPSGAPAEPFTWELEVPTADPYPASTEDGTSPAEGDPPEAAADGEPKFTNMPPQTDTPFGYMVALGDLEPKHYELIAAASNGVMFDWERPYVMVKQSGRADLRYLRAATKRWMREQGK